MSGRPPSAEAARRSGVALLALALVVPALFVGLGEAPRAAGPERAVLVAPDATPEAPSDRDAASAPLLVVFPAGIVRAAFDLPEPVVARLAPGATDRISGEAVLPFLPPPPRRA